MGLFDKAETAIRAALRGAVAVVGRALPVHGVAAARAIQRAFSALGRDGRNELQSALQAFFHFPVVRLDFLPRRKVTLIACDRGLVGLVTRTPLEDSELLAPDQTANVHPGPAGTTAHQQFELVGFWQASASRFKSSSGMRSRSLMMPAYFSA